jgi:hypothetical protein
MASKLDHIAAGKDVSLWCAWFDMLLHWCNLLVGCTRAGNWIHAGSALGRLSVPDCML